MSCSRSTASSDTFFTFHVFKKVLVTRISTKTLNVYNWHAEDASLEEVSVPKAYLDNVEVS